MNNNPSLDFSSWKLSGKLAPSERAHSLAFSSDGCWLAFSDVPYIRILDIRSNKFIQSIKVLTKLSNSMSFSPDGEWLACGESSGHIHIWKLPEFKYVYTLQAKGNVKQLIFNGENGLFAGTANGHVLYWVLDRGLGYPRLSYADGIETMALSPDHRLLGIGSLKGTVSLWDAQNGSCVYIWRIKNGPMDPIGRMWINGLGFIADNLLLSCHDTAEFNIWDTSYLQNVRTIKQTGNTKAIALSRDKRTLAQTSVNEVTLWDTISWASHHLAPKHSVALLSYGKPTIAFSPDGLRIASSGVKNEIFVWEGN
ncbi:MAG: WD40 repeat domain-containing protein [Anaerolineales bacterium]